MSKTLLVEMMQSCPVANRAIGEIVMRDQARLADFFYTSMLADQEAAGFLAPRAVQYRL